MRFYAFVSDPENLRKWAKGLCQSVERAGEEWIVRTPDGPVKIRFVEKNAFRICDHFVPLPSGDEVYVPMRVLANGPGSEVVFTLFRQAGITGEAFERDQALVSADLSMLKVVLEDGA